jgi:zinc transporter ZupT
MNHLDVLTKLAPLFAALGATTAGVLAARALGRTRASRVLNAAATLGIATLVCAHLLPECAEVIGPLAFVLAAATAAAPRLAARALGRSEPRPPHPAPAASPRPRRRPGQAPRGRAAVAALAVHALADGFALALPVAAGGAAFGGLQAALIFHRIPEGAARWWLLGPLERRRRALAFAGLGLATLGGFGLGLVVAANAGGPAIAALQAMAAGLLLHVVAHRGERLVRVGRRLARRLAALAAPAAPTSPEAAPGVTLRP